MANLEIRDGDQAEKRLKATGVGSDADPFILEHKETSAADTLTAAQAIRAAVETLNVASVAIPSAIFNGQETVDAAGTAQAIGTTQALLSGVTVKALSGNAGLVYVGNSGVSSANGFELAAGESTFIVTDDVASVFVDAATNGDGVCWQGS